MRPDVYKVDGFEIEACYIKFVEGELRRFRGRERRLSRLIGEVGGVEERDIILATPNFDPGMPKAAGTGDPTQKKAMNLFRREEIAGLAMQVRIVRETFDQLPPELQEVVSTVYFAGRWTMEGAAMELGIDRGTLRTRCNRALVAFVQAIVGDYAVKSA